MSNKPSDAEIESIVKLELNEYLDGAYQDHNGAKDQLMRFARAVLAKWGTPQPVVREPLTREEIDAVMRKSVGYGLSPSRDDLELVRAIEQAHGITQKGGSSAAIHTKDLYDRP